MTGYQYERLMGQLGRIESLLERMVAVLEAPLPDYEAIQRKLIEEGVAKARQGAVEAIRQRDAERLAEERLRHVPSRPVD